MFHHDTFCLTILLSLCSQRVQGVFQLENCEEFLAITSQWYLAKLVLQLGHFVPKSFACFLYNTIMGVAKWERDGSHFFLWQCEVRTILTPQKPLQRTLPNVFCTKLCSNHRVRVRLKLWHSHVFEKKSFCSDQRVVSTPSHHSRFAWNQLVCKNSYKLCYRSKNFLK